jgi:uncharacterized heparinase superfamily protein
LLNKFLRLYHTVKYLKLKQVYWRVFNFLPRLINEVKFTPQTYFNQTSTYFLFKKRSTTDYNKFTFLNETHILKEIGWDNKSISKLWRYNLHYFDYLLQDDNYHIQDKIILIENWIENNPFGKGTGWEPYPTSLRIINWIKWHWITDGLSENAKLSLWNQVRWLSNNLEYHLLGNHLFINVKSLLFASAFFKSDFNSFYYKKTISILQNELNEQFLNDGAHFELSPMYHSLAMEDLLDLINISDKLPNNFPIKNIREKYTKGMYWLKTMIYNNDELSHFNDCANGIAPTYTDLENYENKLGIIREEFINNILHYHNESGFIIYNDEKTHLIADFGKIGPDYLPGHAHADTLSFELAVNKERVIVNTGTSLYGNSKERHIQRGTSTHSTVQIDNKNSSEVWSGFRVGRRAVTFNTMIELTPNSKSLVNFQSSHDGYKRLKNKPVHTRKFCFSNNIWTIEDVVSGKMNEVLSRFYLHPDIEIRKIENGLILFKKCIDLIKIVFDDKLNLRIVESLYHDEFGVNKHNKCIQIKGVSPLIIKLKFEIL